MIVRRLDDLRDRGPVACVWIYDPKMKTLSPKSGLSVKIPVEPRRRRGRE